MTNVTYISRANSIKKIIEELSDSSDIDELVVVRSYRDADGERQMEWMYSPLESKFWAAGALNFVISQMLEKEPNEQETP